MSRLRVQVVTNLFPNRLDPGFAPFNRIQFEHLRSFVDLDIDAVVPLRTSQWLKNGRLLPLRENVGAARVRHPPFVSIPGLPGLNAASLAATLAPRAAMSRALGRSPDVILASYAYPEGVASVALGRMLHVPVVIKCHGSDLNRVPEAWLPRQQLKQALCRAAHVVCVSRGLMATAIELGARKDRTSVVYNGVDRRRFSPRDRGAARKRLGLDPERKLVLFIGHLAEHKGAADLLSAVPLAAGDVDFAVAGAGPLAGDVEQTPRVRKLGQIGRDDVASWIAACDLLCLPSWTEGMPNVVREAHASGRRVVATRVGGIPEAVHHPDLGRLVAPRDPPALAKAIEQTLREPEPSPHRIVELAGVPSWRESARELAAVLEAAAYETAH